MTCMCVGIYCTLKCILLNVNCILLNVNFFFLQYQWKYQQNFKGIMCIYYVLTNKHIESVPLSFRWTICFYIQTFHNAFSHWSTSSTNHSSTQPLHVLSAQSLHVLSTVHPPSCSILSVTFARFFITLRLHSVACLGCRYWWGIPDQTLDRSTSLRSPQSIK
jgi:hypothetical protein